MNITIIKRQEVLLVRGKTAIGYLCRMVKVVLQKKISQRVANGHPWIFSNEIDKIEGDVKPGDIVEVLQFDKKFVGERIHKS